MVNRSSKNMFILVLLIIVFGLAGAAIGDIIENEITALAFLGKDFSIGIKNPLFVDLKIITFTFGIVVKMNLMALTGIVIGIFIYKKMQG